MHAVTRPPTPVHQGGKEGGRELAGDAVLVFHDLGLDGTCGLAGIGDPEPQLLGDLCILSCPRAKLEGDDVRVLLLCCDLEDVFKGVFVLDTPPSCPVRELAQYNQLVRGEQNVAVKCRGFMIKWRAYCRAEIYTGEM